MNKRYCYAGEVNGTNGWRISEICPVCRTPYLLQLTDLYLGVERGSIYPDFLHCPAGILVISENVLNAWQKTGIKGYSYYQAHVDKIYTKGLKGKNVPIYYHIAIDGFCDIERKRTDIEIIYECKKCGVIKYKQKWDTGEAKFAFDYETWDGTNILRTKIFNFPFCTREIVECALRTNHTGVRFFHSQDVLRGDKRHIEKIEDIV